MTYRLAEIGDEEAIPLTADEIWVIWTVSENDERYTIFIATYFQITKQMCLDPRKRLER